MKMFCSCIHEVDAFGHYAPNKPYVNTRTTYALNSEVRLITRVYGNTILQVAISLVSLKIQHRCSGVLGLEKKLTYISNKISVNGMAMEVGRFTSVFSQCTF